MFAPAQIGTSEPLLMCQADRSGLAHLFGNTAHLVTASRQKSGLNALDRRNYSSAGTSLVCSAPRFDMSGERTHRCGCDIRTGSVRQAKCPPGSSGHTPIILDVPIRRFAIEEPRRKRRNGRTSNRRCRLFRKLQERTLISPDDLRFPIFDLDVKAVAKAETSRLCST